LGGIEPAPLRGVERRGEHVHLAAAHRHRAIALRFVDGGELVRLLRDRVVPDAEYDERCRHHSNETLHASPPFSRAAVYARHPPYLVISGCPSQSSGSPSTPSVSRPSSSVTLPMQSPAGSRARMSAIPAAGTSHTSTAIAAP